MKVSQYVLTCFQDRQVARQRQLTGLDIKLECITELLESNTHLVKSRAIYRADVLDGGTKVSASAAHSRVEGPEPRASCSGVSPPPTLLF